MDKKNVLSRLNRYQISYCAGEVLKETFLKEYSKHGSIKLAIIESLDESFKDLVKDFEYHFSDESIIEFYSNFSANEFIFNEHGCII